LSSIVTAARVLLEEFARSDWRDLHLRTREGTIFIAKTDGVENPMRQRASPQGEVSEGLVLAPHVATVVSTRDLHSRVAAGEVVVTLSLLGESIEVRSPTKGVVAAIFVSSGELAEYGKPLVRIAAVAGDSSPPPPHV
jgi:biotin carboxyl carrier protein